MAATKFTIGQKSTATIGFQDKHGNSASVDGVPQWASTNSAAFSVTPSTDGMSAEVECIGLGAGQIQAIADADLDPGETRELTILGDVEGIPEEAVAGTMTFSAPA
jgi:hypothetical protein